MITVTNAGKEVNLFVKNDNGHIMLKPKQHLADCVALTHITTATKYSKRRFGVMLIETFEMYEFSTSKDAITAMLMLQQILE